MKLILKAPIKQHRIKIYGRLKLLYIEILYAFNRPFSMHTERYTVFIWKEPWYRYRQKQEKWNHRQRYWLSSIPVGDSFYFPFFPRLPFSFSGGRPSPLPSSFSRCASAISAFISTISALSFSSRSSRVCAWRTQYGARSRCRITYGDRDMFFAVLF